MLATLMPREHRVLQGECMTSIAIHYGFFWRALWKLPENAELEQLRGDPNALAPGDTIHIPDLRDTTVTRATDTRHKFRRKGTPARFQVQLLAGGKPRANLRYTLLVDGVPNEGVSDGEGCINVGISPRARQGRLLIHADDDEREPEVYELNFGHLDPIGTLSGVQGRLQNLGWYQGPVDGNLSEEFEDALAQFQREHGLSVTREADEPTRNKLEQVHGR
jgi:hypothetical protein